ncbi:MAG: hypothetical protein MUF50_02135 [Planctomycetes bacterium]|jgi:UDPglucose 6-dehydrogenase|nr:hypothetical protein [Planctomycetota bacterium]
MLPNILIGCIGQGFIGKNLANDFENRGYSIVRYSKEPEYEMNREQIAKCDIVFIAVPTPTTPQGFNFDILKEVIALVGVGKSAVIKSTIMPGVCEELQVLYKDRFIFHSPEFLTEVNAAFDTAHPTRNIVGCPIDNEEYKKRAQQILAILPEAPVNLICRAKEAELIKYGSNCFLFLKVVYMNVLYDLAQKEDCDWEKIKIGLKADSRLGSSHFDPIHASGIDGKPGRGAGGHCFIKDSVALLEYMKKIGSDVEGIAFLEATINKNIKLLKDSGKDLDLLEAIFGKV